MPHLTETHAAAEVIELLAEMFGTSPKAVRLKDARVGRGYDFSIQVDGHRFLAEYKRSMPAGVLRSAIEQVKHAIENDSKAAIPLIIVPFMGEMGQKLCEQHEVAWLDLSGNARIIAPGVRIRIEGRPNKYSERGRPPDVFAPKSSRIARRLLLDPQRFQTQAELGRETGLDDGYVSKIVRRLQGEKYLDVDEAGAVRPHDPNLLLDAWHDAYDFSRHQIIRGYVAARSGDELLRRVVHEISREKVEGVATGLSAAWLYDRFAAFRLVTVYLSSQPSRSLLKSLDFSDEPKGANLWFVLPNDEGIFRGSQSIAGIRCVSPVQTYLDLKAQPERAKEAAEELRRKNLDWWPRGT